MYDDLEGLETDGSSVSFWLIILFLILLPFGLILFIPSLLYLWWMMHKVEGREHSGLAWLLGLLGVFVAFFNFVAVLGGVALLIIFT
jgi:hypothetical protein